MDQDDGRVLVRPITIFLSSPGDLADERGIARAVVDRLRYDPFLRGKVALEVLAWDTPGGATPMLASETPQESINRTLSRPSNCDIVVVLLWSRMGTPLPFPEYQKVDGEPYLSGTEWEYQDAVQEARVHGRPAVLLYRRTSKVLLDPDADDFEEQIRQRRLVETFFSQFRDPDIGSILAGHKPYGAPEEFRTELESDLRTLISQLISTKTVSPAAATTVSTDTAPLWRESPFPGLRSFTPDDAPIFFGRGREIDRLVARVAQSRFVAVVGASGSGKSSLVGAGLIPRLAVGALPDVPEMLLPTYDRHTEQWLGLRFTPGELGDDPFIALAVKLAPLVRDRVRQIASRLRAVPRDITSYIRRALDGRTPGAEALIFVDQFEEIFTSVAADNVESFVRTLESVTGSTNGRVVATMRSDFYHRCLEMPALSRLLEAGQFPLSAPIDTLLDMITRPAERAGLRFEEGLPGRILIDTGGQPGALPLMAYTLDELYRARSVSGELSLASYEALGRVQGAIGTRAEYVFQNDLDEATRHCFSRVFRKLVDVDDQGRATRRRVALREFGADQECMRLVQVFTDARLLVQADEHEHQPVVFVAHEALFQSWERLHLWLEAIQDDLHLERRVRSAAQEWDENERDESYLWPHERLAPVYEMIERLDPELDSVTQQFVTPEYERLLDVLRASETEPYRIQVIADRLAAIGRPALPSLLQALRGGATARTAAVGALVRVGEPSVPGLIDATKDSVADVRIAAVAALRQIGDSRAVSALAALLRDNETSVRSLAAGSLAAFPVADASVAEALADALRDADLDVRWRAAGAIGAFGDTAVPALVRMLQADDIEASKAALEALQTIGEAGLGRLVEMFRDAGGREQTVAARALAALGQASIPPLLASLADGDPGTRWRAADALGAIGDAAAEQGLIRALQDPAARVRAFAAAALQDIATEQAVQPLVRLLGDGDPQVASNAATALRHAGPAGQVALLDALRRTDQPRVSALAASVLSETVPMADTGLVAVIRSANRAARLRAVGALVDHGGSAVPCLIELLTDPDTEVRELALNSLVAIGEMAAGPLVGLVENADPAIRQMAAKVLARLPSRARQSLLAELLGDADPIVREAAASGLAAIGEESLPVLFPALRDSDELKSNVAGRALALVGGPAVPGLLQLAVHGDQRARDKAIATLSEIRSPAAVFGLAELSPLGGVQPDQ